MFCLCKETIGKTNKIGEKVGTNSKGIYFVPREFV